MTDTNEEDVADVTDIVEAKDDKGADTTDWKAIALEKQELATKNFNIAQRYKKQADKVKDAIKPETQEKPVEKSNELTEGQLALLRVDGIKGKEELALVKEYLASGKQLLDIMENKHFLNDLKDMREEKATVAAVPKNAQRTNNSAKDTQEFWTGKYLAGTQLNEIPREFRGAVLNARLKNEGPGGGAKFYNS